MSMITMYYASTTFNFHTTPLLFSPHFLSRPFFADCNFSTLIVDDSKDWFSLRSDAILFISLKKNKSHTLPNN